MLKAKRIYYIYCGACALIFSLIFTTKAVYYVETIGLTPLELVLVGTVLEVTYFIFDIPTGILADLKSRKLSMIIGLIIMGGGFLLEGIIPLFIAVIGAQVIWGIGISFITGSEEAWIADELENKELECVYLRGAQIGQAFALLGIILSAVFGIIALNLPIIIGGGSFILLSLFLAFSMPEEKFTPSVPEELNPIKKMTYMFKQGFNVVIKSKVWMMILCISLFFGLASEGIDRLWEAFFMKEVQLPHYLQFNYVFIIAFISGISMILGIIATHLIIKKFNKENKLENIRYLIILNFLLILSFIAFSLVGQFYLALSFYFSIYILRTVNAPIFSACMNRLVTSDLRATVISFTHQFNSFGQIIGGPLLGFIAQLLSIRFTMFSSGVLLIPVLWLFIKIQYDQKRVGV